MRRALRPRASAAAAHTLTPRRARNSCCVDEVAAAHADADCVVHFGRSCLSPVSRLPARLLFAKQPLDVTHLAARLTEVRAARRPPAAGVG